MGHAPPGLRPRPGAAGSTAGGAAADPFKARASALRGWDGPTGIIARCETGIIPPERPSALMRQERYQHVDVVTLFEPSYEICVPVELSVNFWQVESLACVPIGVAVIT